MRTIVGVRFRAGEGSTVVLQVATQENSSRSHYAYDREPDWRDAKVEDLLHVDAHLRLGK